MSQGMTELRGDSVLLAGFGREGRSSYEYLSKHYPSLRIGVADQQELEVDLREEVELYFAENYLSAFEKFDTVVRTPGISLSSEEFSIAKTSGAWVTSLSNIFMEICPGRVVGVTGTKGKSTTAALTAHILRCAGCDVRLVGNIGRPALDYLESADEHTIFVAEFSSFQLEDMRYAPYVAVMLDIVPEHLNYHGSFSDYRNAKYNLVRNQSASDYLVTNQQYKYTEEIFALSKAQVCLFGDDTQILEDLSLKIRGPGNKQNALAAVEAAKIFSIEEKVIREALSSFEPLPHRLQHVGTFSGIEFYNDSLATNPNATINALDSLGEHVHTLILGGQDRGLEYSGLARRLLSSNVEQLILFPDTGRYIWNACLELDESVASRINVTDVSDMKEAIELAYRLTPAEKICLLSPASSSLNMFRDYAERGEKFIESVRQLAAS